MHFKKIFSTQILLLIITVFSFKEICYAQPYLKDTLRPAIGKTVPRIKEAVSSIQSLSQLTYENSPSDFEQAIETFSHIDIAEQIIEWAKNVHNVPIQKLVKALADKKASPKIISLGKYLASKDDADDNLHFIFVNVWIGFAKSKNHDEVTHFFDGLISSHKLHFVKYIVFGIGVHSLEPRLRNNKDFSELEFYLEYLAGICIKENPEAGVKTLAEAFVYSVESNIADYEEEAYYYVNNLLNGILNWDVKEPTDEKIALGEKFIREICTKIAFKNKYMDKSIAKGIIYSNIPELITAFIESSIHANQIDTLQYILEEAYLIEKVSKDSAIKVSKKLIPLMTDLADKSINESKKDNLDKIIQICINLHLEEKNTTGKKILTKISEKLTNDTAKAKGLLTQRRHVRNAV